MPTQLDQTASIPGANLIDPNVLARIGNLELLARIVVDGFINGLHRAPHLGSSTDFAEHRLYTPGDDTRKVCGFNALRYSAGFGVRWFSPMGPLRFEWGFPIAPKTYDQKMRFDFTIGQFF